MRRNLYPLGYDEETDDEETDLHPPPIQSIIENEEESILEQQMAHIFSYKIVILLSRCFELSISKKIYNSTAFLHLFFIKTYFQ